MREFSNHAVLSMSDSTMAVSSKYKQHLSVQIVFLKFLLNGGCNLSYIVDLFSGLHELTSACARTLLKLASSVCVMLKPYGDTLTTFAPIVSAHPYCARKFTCHIMHRASALSTKMNNDILFFSETDFIYNYLHIVQKWTKTQCGNVKKIQVFCPRNIESCHHVAAWNWRC